MLDLDYNLMVLTLFPHLGLHFFTRFPKGVVNPFIYSLPEGFTIERKWWGQGGDHWATTHDIRSETEFDLICDEGRRERV